ncbi:uncharacterized protein LOC126900275 [Daktulosphaira vitifoliae]|uniref:uncharacterized protein LOC126900275 n=1 Tax=Daktulosphaira vitifoliae TaxID=58002 RepID=UPI0021A9EE97|nr:uncharacterized protein LOC126900275 [Daktulosphaira vitifoliae]
MSNTYNLYVQANAIISSFPSVNNVDKESLDTAKEKFSNALSCFYGYVLLKLHRFYRNIPPIYIPPNYIEKDKLNQLNKLIKIICTFKPLLTCMANALECFESSFQKDILEILKQSLTLTENLEKLDETYDYDAVIKEINDSTNIQVDYKDYKVKISKNECILNKYFDKLLSVFDNNKEFSTFKKIARHSVKLFCKNFNFTQKV